MPSDGAGGAIGAMTGGSIALADCSLATTDVLADLVFGESSLRLNAAGIIESLAARRLLLTLFIVYR